MVKNKNKKEKIMKNKKFLERASKLQKEFAGLYKGTGLVGIGACDVQITAKLFHELEKENLLEHISKKLEKKGVYWDYKAMTPDGVRVIAIEYVSKMEKT